MADTRAHPEPVLIRVEKPSDHAEIARLTTLAFAPQPYAAGDEAEVVDRLRSHRALALSLVAVSGTAIVGHAAFSPADGSDDQHWFALGPISVHPSRQHQGIGTMLIKQGLDQLKAWSAAGCILTGNPAYYQRFGWQPSPSNAPTNEPAEFFMVKLLSGRLPTGRFAFHRAFYG
ncbi:MAG: N-acetyltransferase [Pseudomonadota bacterium]